MRDIWEPFVTVLIAIVGVAMVATLVSRNAQTPAVFASFGSMIANMLSAATGPVTGSAATPAVNLGASGSGFNLSMPSMGSLSMPNFG